MATHAISSLPFWLMMTGLVLSTLIYLGRPSIANTVRQRLPFLYRLLDHKYYFDEFYQKVFAGGSVRLGSILWNKADAGFIDNGIVNGSARVVEWMATRVRRWQTGLLYDYAFAMIIGLIGILAVWVAMVP
jgi:NADH-quinone oxidoreductase subunit L